MIKTLDSALNIEVLDLKSLFYLGKDEQYPEILLSILPVLSCVPNILVDYGITSWERWSEWGPPIQALYAELRSIQEDEGSLGAEQVQKLGELAATIEDHPLRRLSGFLKREAMAEKITQRWNRRYGWEQMDQIGKSLEVWCLGSQLLYVWSVHYVNINLLWSSTRLLSHCSLLLGIRQREWENDETRDDVKLVLFEKMQELKICLDSRFNPSRPAKLHFNSIQFLGCCQANKGDREDTSSIKLS